jgi:RNA polymerase sigma factor (sigma-70 family)
MASGRSAASLKHLQTLFQVGTVSGLTDGQLLDHFVQSRDEAAFAALVERHGPMVLRVCRSRLGNHHSAEDAFQATFLVLAQNARSIRKSEAVAGWLFGVAGRVSARARFAARRRSLAEQEAGLSQHSATKHQPSEPLAELYDELERLPERYRLPIVLCHLEGLTYEQAAARLDCPVRTVHTRLARGRERLRGRLARRGLAPGAERLAPVLPLHSESLIVRGSLKEATVRAALRFANLKGAAAGASSAVGALAREVSRAMFLAKTNLIVRFVLLAGLIGAGAWAAWPGSDPQPFAPPTDRVARLLARRAARAGPARNNQSKAAGDPKAAENPDSPPWNLAVAGKPDERYYMTGFVRVDETGEPVAGARVQAMFGSTDARTDLREAITDADGRYTVALPEGNAQAFFVTLPAGYYLAQPKMPGGLFESFAVTPHQPVFRKDYVVRRGTVWKFRLTRGANQEPVRSAAVWQSGFNRPETDDKGFADLTLPSEAGNTALVLWANRKNEPMLNVTVRWDQEFRPDAVKDVKRTEVRGRPPQFQLTDDAGRTATIAGPVNPVATTGRLVCSVSLPDTTNRATGTLTGTVLDLDGRPVEDANVTIFYQFREGRGTLSDRTEHRVRTDAQGRYALPSIPRQSHEGDPTKLVLVVYKEGYAGFDSPEFLFQPGKDGTQVANPVRLQPGLTLIGTVVDPDGRPVAGALISPRQGWATGMRTYRSGPDGRFSIPGLTKGEIPIFFTFGKLTAAPKHVVDGKGELTVQLRAAPGANPPAAAAQPEPAPLEVGQPAPEWQVRGWTDANSRSLADCRGKVVFLGFWGIWCGPCVKALPLVEKLRGKYETRGVLFLEIHTPGDTLENMRKLFALENVALISALDEGADNDNWAGTTARTYGVRGYPTAFLIDRSGKIAFRSDDPASQPVLEALSKKFSTKLGINTDAALTDEQSRQLREAVLGEIIDKALAAP